MKFFQKRKSQDPAATVTKLTEQLLARKAVPDVSIANYLRDLEGVLAGLVSRSDVNAAVSADVEAATAALRRAQGDRRFAARLTAMAAALALHYGEALPTAATILQSAAVNGYEIMKTQPETANRTCTHPKIESGACRAFGCQNFEPDLAFDSEGRPCPHTKDEARHCFIPLCWNSRFAGNPQVAHALDAAIRGAVVKHADEAFEGTGVDWRSEFGGVEGLVGSISGEGAPEPFARPLAQFDDRPLPTTQDEADRLFADMASAALGRRVERRPGPPPPPSRQLIVGADGGATFTTIAAALAVAADGDEILVRPGDYRESLVIDRSVTIRGDGPREQIVVHPMSEKLPCVSITANEPRISGLTISGVDLAPRDEETPLELIQIVGGSPVLEDLDLAGGDVCVSLAGPETAGAIRSCMVHDGMSGIVIFAGASPRVEENKVWGNAKAGITIGGVGTDPLVRANHVHDGEDVGIAIRDGASPRIEENEVWGNARSGIGIGDAGTNPVIRANRVHDSRSNGIFVTAGALPQIDENEIWGHEISGIWAEGAGTNPLIRANQAHSGLNGIAVFDGASPRIEENDVWGNAQTGIAVSGAGTNPIVRANRVHDGQSGIAVVDGALPQLEENEVWGNAMPGITISGDGTAALVRANRVHDGQSHGIFVAKGASPRIEGNEVWGNAHPGGIVIKGVRTDPLVRANRVHDSESYGILVQESASPRIEENEVWDNAMPGIYVSGAGTNPLVRANRVHGSSTDGIAIVDGASPRIEENEVWATALRGIMVNGSGTDPLVRANRVHDSRGGGIDVRQGASPHVEDNEVWANGGSGIIIAGNGTNPVVRANRVHDGESAGIFVLSGAAPHIEANEVWANLQGGVVVQGAAPVLSGNVVREETSPIVDSDRDGTRVDEAGGGH